MKQGACHDQQKYATLLEILQTEVNQPDETLAVASRMNIKINRMCETMHKNVTHEI